jgi:hypothetical protein
MYRNKDEQKAAEPQVIVTTLDYCNEPLGQIAVASQVQH